MAQSRTFEPQVFFPPGGVLDHTNPWIASQRTPVGEWRPEAADVLFLAGTDWDALPAERQRPSQPILNLVQGFRHADPIDRRYQFLSARAIRICVSPEVTAAVRATGRARGPLLTIANGIDLEAMAPSDHRDIDVLIVGAKRPQLAAELAEMLRAGSVLALTEPLPRRTFLELLGRSRVVALLPFDVEGFYLPALEAMASGAIVVCPDCVGNRSFCHDAVNCLVPMYRSDAIADAVHAARRLSQEAAGEMLARADETARAHDLRRERAAFLDILEHVFDLWASAEPA